MVDGRPCLELECIGKTLHVYHFRAQWGHEMYPAEKYAPIIMDIASRNAFGVTERVALGGFYRSKNLVDLEKRTEFGYDSWYYRQLLPRLPGYKIETNSAPL